MRRRDALKLISTAPFAVMAQQTNAPRAYDSTWDSIDKRPVPKWYTDAKFGIFIHWGLYSVPAYAAPNVKDENPYAEWYWNSHRRYAGHYADRTRRDDLGIP